MFVILRVVVAILLAAWLFRQVRRPSGWLGRRVVRAMNVSHATMTEWGLQHVTVAKGAAVLDVGCGGGSTVRRLAALASEGKVTGLDYSAASVAVARDTNAKEVAAGRVQIKRGSVLSSKGESRKRRYRFTNPLMQPYIILQGLIDKRIDARTLERETLANF